MRLIPPSIAVNAGLTWLIEWRFQLLQVGRAELGLVACPHCGLADRRRGRGRSAGCLADGEVSS